MSNKETKRRGRKPRTPEQIEASVLYYVDENWRITRDSRCFIIERKYALKTPDGSKKQVWFGKYFFSTLPQLYKHLIENIGLDPNCPLHDIVKKYEETMKMIDKIQSIAVRNLKKPTA